MSLSKIGLSIGESVTLKLNQTFASLKAMGEPVIHLGGGEPIGKAPNEALVSLSEHLSTGEVRYAPVAGSPEMKKAIINYTVNRYGKEVELPNVIASGGAKQALMISLQAILDPEDEVMFPVPYWVSYTEMVKLCGAIPVPIQPLEGTFNPCIEDLKNKFSSRTKAIIINSPNNPSGAIYSPEFIKDVVAFCEEKDIYLIMDDIYHLLTFNGKKAANVFDFVKKPLDDSKLIIINGVSKAYAMTGFRIGWAVANKRLIKVMTNIQAHQTSGTSILLQKASIGAINGDQSTVSNIKSTLEKNRKVLIEQLKTLPKIKLNEPEGTFYSFADFSAYEKDSAKLSEILLKEARVLTMPGIEFGLEGHLRISFCGSEEDIVEGIKRIRLVLES